MATMKARHHRQAKTHRARNMQVYNVWHNKAGESFFPREMLQIEAKTLLAAKLKATKLFPNMLEGEAIGIQLDGGDQYVTAFKENGRWYTM